MEALSEKRIRASFFGTVGYLTGNTKKPLSRSNSDISTLFSFEPQIIGTICDSPLVSNPRSWSTHRNFADISANFILRS